MAVTSVGFDGTITESQWARLQRAAGHLGNHQGVTTGMDATVTGGTREVSVSSGTAYVCGVLVDSDSVELRTFAANGGTANRVDYLVLRVDWVNNVSSITVKQGASTVAPSLSQVEGTLWEMPLARVTIRPGATVLSASDVEACKPLPRVERVFDDSDFPVTSVNYNGTAKVIGSVNVTDPGWPYRLHLYGAARFKSNPNGHGKLQLTVGGVVVATGTSMRLDNAGWIPCHVQSRTLNAYTGVVVAQLQMLPLGMSSGSLDLAASDVMNQYRVCQIPA